MTSDIQTTHDVPSVEEYLRLRQQGGLSAFSPPAARIGLQGTLHAVTLRHDGKAIGMGRLIGDGGCFFQIVDIAVEPRYRGQGLGKRIMAALMDYIDKNLPATAFVSLLADVPADRLYAQSGFTPTAPESLGMSYRVKRDATEGP